MPRELTVGSDHNLLGNRTGGDPHPMYGRKDTHGPGGTLPGGVTTGQVLYWDGTAWVANSNLSINPPEITVSPRLLGTYIQATDAIHIEDADRTKKLYVVNAATDAIFEVDTLNDVLKLFGALRVLRKAVAASPYNVAARDTYLAVNTGAAITINLPAASAGERMLVVKDAVGAGALVNNITIARNGADTIELVGANYVVATTRNALWLYSDGVSNWELLSLA